MNNSVVGRKVRVLRMHAATHIEGIGSIPVTLTTALKSQGDISMLVLDVGVFIKGKVKGEGFVPWGNIISVDLLPE